MRIVLETPRLSLREMALSDLDFVAEMLADPELMRFYPRPLSRDESEEWIERQLARYATDGHALWLAEDRVSLAPVGQVGLILQDVEGSREPEIGYLIHRPFWRHGLATEAALGVRAHAFGALSVRRVISLVRPENSPSRRVARKLGMKPEREVEFRGLRHLVFTVSREETPEWSRIAPEQA
jgi:ribosomal-protein-alanine N-acetyltransferase